MKLTHLEHGDRYVACRRSNPAPASLERSDNPHHVTCPKCRETEWFRMLLSGIATRAAA